tara:strand:+ start:662 stop:1954 length:1293 start_codon:yes stop_codon:yes gene_type:complete
MNYNNRLRNEILARGGEFIATGNLIHDMVSKKWDNPTGAFNVALKNNLVEMSVADDWKEARKEWKATGKVWYIPLADDATDVLPEPHKSSHPHYCVCGHPIAWHFEIENTENGRLEVVGSEHIGFWMIVRHLVENLEMDPEEVTQERVKEWVKEAIKSMKAEWWWSQYGEEFEEWFSAIREQDLILNTRQGPQYYDNDTARNEHKRLIRKKGVGTRGTNEFQMPSIVWRWNHPDNDKTAQINTTGYPNRDLWNDLQMFYFNLDKHNAKIEEMNRERQERIEEIAEQRRVMEEERRERNRLHEERMQRQAERRRQEQIEHQRLLDTAFERTCSEWGIVQFTAESGRDAWEQDFLLKMIKRINSLDYISEKQKQRVIKIINREDEPATEKQLSYIRALGGEPNPNLTKIKASKMIDELKNPPEVVITDEEEE